MNSIGDFLFFTFGVLCLAAGLYVGFPFITAALYSCLFWLY